MSDFKDDSIGCLIELAFLIFAFGVILFMLYATKDLRNKPEQEIRIHLDGTRDTTFIYSNDQLPASNKITRRRAN